jgi:hypothetical protein
MSSVQLRDHIGFDGRLDSTSSKNAFGKTSVRDQAALLLSIADICNSEISKFPMALSYDDDSDDGLPKFPLLEEKDAKHVKWNTYHTDSLNSLLVRATSYPLHPSNRVRTVSMDAQDFKILRAPSPLASPPALVKAIPVTPTTPKQVHRSLRLFSQARRHRAREALKEAIKEECVQIKNGNVLQGDVPKGVNVKKIYRRKFSWKSYPELEEFLVANREEYLRHSALNYTLQQKQYNNLLTEKLLELATKHGYMFDTTDFNFVTVRDRIRCYYKSFVQSAKKRGHLLGYAARKAGLLNEDELEESASNAVKIITPR